MGSPIHLCCYIDSDTHGGMEASLATLLGQLSDAFRVTLLGTAAEVVSAIAAARPATAVRTVPRVDSKRDVRAMAAHVRALRSIRPDVLHASLGQLWKGQYGLLAGRLTRTPTVAVVHCVLPASSRLQVMLFRSLARTVDVYAGVSRSVCRDTDAALGFPAGITQLVYNGVPEPMCDPPVELGDAPRPIVAAVGRLRAEKGYDDLIHAMVSIPEATLVLVGDGEERNALANLAVDIGVADRLRMPGWLTDPWRMVSQADVVAIPSRAEGFGLVAVEAMLARLPVVAYRVGGLAEVVEEDVTGLLVPPGDREALAAALKQLVTNPSLRRHLGEAARASAQHRFSVPAMTQWYEKIFRSLAGDRAKRQ